MYGLRGGDGEVDLGVEIKAEDDDASITGYLILQKRVNGKWKGVRSLRINDTGYVDESATYSVSSGRYRAKLYARVNSEKIRKTSSSCYVD